MDPGDLFSSKAKYRILQILSTRSSPIHLRGISEAAGIAIRSAQLAVEDLVSKKVINKKREGNRTLLTLNPRSGYAKLLRTHFRNVSNASIERQAKKWRDSKELLNRIHELRMLSWEG